MGSDLHFCLETADVWQVVGYFLLVFKIIIPILLIIFGMVDLGKAVISSDDKAVSKAATSLLKRAISGVVIFFVPTIVGLVFGLINNFNNTAKKDYNYCKDCLIDPTGKDCKNHVNSKS